MTYYRLPPAKRKRGRPRKVQRDAVAVSAWLDREDLAYARSAALLVRKSVSDLVREAVLAYCQVILRNHSHVPVTHCLCSRCKLLIKRGELRYAPKPKDEEKCQKTGHTK